MWGLIEQEIRLLPHVLACSVSGNEVVVLADTSADPGALDGAVREVLDRHESSVPVKIFGGKQPAAIGAGLSRARAGILIGVVAGATALGASALVAGLTVDHRSNQRPFPRALATASPTTEPSSRVRPSPVSPKSPVTTPTPQRVRQVATTPVLPVTPHLPRPSVSPSVRPSPQADDLCPSDDDELAERADADDEVNAESDAERPDERCEEGSESEPPEHRMDDGTS